MGRVVRIQIQCHIPEKVIEEAEACVKVYLLLDNYMSRGPNHSLHVHSHKYIAYFIIVSIDAHVHSPCEYERTQW